MGSNTMTARAPPSIIRLTGAPKVAPKNAQSSVQRVRPSIRIDAAAPSHAVVEGDVKDETLSLDGSQLGSPMLNKKRRKSEFAEGAPETPTKRRKTAKAEQKQGQSPAAAENSGEEGGPSHRESFPDPRFMNDPRNNLGLKDHKYKYISKITNKFLREPDWSEKAKKYQDVQQKKTGSWKSLNKHLYPDVRDVPPSVNPLDLILEAIIDNGAATQEDLNQDPSIYGCFVRLMDRLVDESGNRQLRDSMKQSLATTISIRERACLDESAPDTPGASADIVADSVLSPTTINTENGPDPRIELSRQSSTDGTAYRRVTAMDESAIRQHATASSPRSQGIAPRRIPPGTVRNSFSRTGMSSVYGPTGIVENMNLDSQQANSLTSPVQFVPTAGPDPTMYFSGSNNFTVDCHPPLAPSYLDYTAAEQYLSLPVTTGPVSAMTFPLLPEDQAWAAFLTPQGSGSTTPQSFGPSLPLDHSLNGNVGDDFQNYFLFQ